MLVVGWFAWWAAFGARRAAQRECMHHQLAPGAGEEHVSWITGRLVDSGSRKLHSCSRCGQHWW